MSVPPRAGAHRGRSIGGRVGAWRDQHARALHDSLGRWRRRPLSSLVTVLVLGFALCLPLLAWLLFGNARLVADELRDARGISVFMAADETLDAARSLAVELGRRSDVAAVEVRSPEQNLAELTALPGLGVALEAMGEGNPLPAVLVVTPREGPGEAAAALLQVLAADPRVDFVQHDAGWRQRLASVLAVGERALGVLALLLGLASLLVVGNTVAADVARRREEILVLQLVGASPRYIRRPFLYAGVCYGLAGGALALLLALAVQQALARPLQALVESYGERFQPHGLGPASAIALVIIAAALGWLGARIATARQLATAPQDP